MAGLSLSAVRKRFGEDEVLKGVDIEVGDREFLVFVGPSGCGKSTLLRVIAGLEDLSDGRLVLGNEDITWMEPADRGIAMVFQSYALYPHMSVRDNMAFGLKMAKMTQDEIDRRIAEAARILQISNMLDRKPRQLSGGQRQRVAIGRAIVRNPKLFLFDEPLSNLDAALRVEMRGELARLHQELQTTMVYVTHDQSEAMTMADRIVVLNAGRVEQIGTPLELYQYPVNRFVGEFIGSPKMNILPVAARPDAGGLTVTLPGGKAFPAPFDMTGAATESDGETLYLGVRPEHILVTTMADGDIPAEVQLAEHMGGETHLRVVLPDGEICVCRVSGIAQQQRGDKVGLKLQDSGIYLFDAQGDALHRKQAFAAKAAAQ